MSVTAAQGFVAAGGASGIKQSGTPDTALIATATGQAVTTVGVFTSNLVAAAPVQVSRAHLAAAPTAAAVILNSGNANAATGIPGKATATAMCDAVAAALGVPLQEVLVCSTGLIGIPMDATPIVNNVPTLVQQLEQSAAAGQAAATAIMTTDTVSKEAVEQVQLLSADGTPTVGIVGGMAKGAAMLEPAMATMLAVVTTDIALSPAAAQLALQAAVDGSFNELSVDGCRSTNDTVLLMCNGLAGNVEITSETDDGYASFAAALRSVCASLALQMANDAEGATKTVTVRVSGARNSAEAKLAARQVANSNLVKCSWYGKDPYWGRVLSELGVSGAQFDPDNVRISYNGIANCIGGVAAEHDAAALAEVMEGRAIDLHCELGAGTASAQVIGTDLTHAYIDENMGTS